MPTASPHAASKMVAIPRGPEDHSPRRFSHVPLSRSFVYSSFKRDAFVSPHSEHLVHSADSVHEDTLDLADVGVLSGGANDEPIMSDVSPAAQFRGPESPQHTNLGFYGSLGGPDSPSSPNNQSFTTYGSVEDYREPAIPPQQLLDPESLKRRPVALSETLYRAFDSVRNSDRDTIVRECIKKPVGYLPAVFLGTLLNVLDALSYGMIMFPIGELCFSKMGPSGLSMFYVSTVVSQLVFSLGGSAFKSGIGSEMIEVTPFFHQMATNIMLALQNENDPLATNRILATTIFSFAISSIITGICFAILGKCKLGKLVGFFPRHILVGCIGGVGYFLVITGIEVSSRLEGGIEYNWPTLAYLLQPLPFIQWTIPLLLAAVLVAIQKFNHSPLIVPMYFIGVFVCFHMVVMLMSGWDLQLARDYGWVFPAQSSSEPWFAFYSHYDFRLCDWWLVLNQLPTMLALTFFGVLHVPINVPALALSSGMDEFDVDRELIAHGISNLLSGAIGSIQNYLVYTNSVLFIRAGADSRLSGVMLAMATFCILLAGPVIIGYIPVCVVGALIYLLGYELLKESVWDTIGSLRKFEYATIVIIVITMGALDFVVGIIVGILLACVSFVIEAGSKRVITEIYTGEYAKSVVVRHPKQQEFLKAVGKQICILKLGGSLFFGSIGGLENEIRSMFEHANFKRQPIKYLILDLHNVQTVDFSAAEGFKRIRNLLVERDCYFLISSVEDKSGIVESLKFCGLWENDEHEERIQLFNNLNSGLEWCENRFLQNYKDLLQKQHSQTQQAQPIDKKKLPMNSFFNSSYVSPDINMGTPRTNNFMSAAHKQYQNEQRQLDLLTKSKGRDRIPSLVSKQPLYLILQIVQGLSTTTDETFWSQLCKYLTRVHYKQGDIVYEKDHEPPCLFLFEQGLINFEITFHDLNFNIRSSELPLTLFGDLVLTKSDRSIKYTAEGECIVWKLDAKSAEKLSRETPKLYQELLAVYIKITSQRFENIASNILIS